MLKKLQDKAFISRQKSLLLTEKTRLKIELDKASKFPNYGDSEESNAQEVEEFTERKGLEKKIRNQLTQIVKALEKIEENEYGRCEICQQAIEIGRLEAVPSAPTCVGCSNKR